MNIHHGLKQHYWKVEQTMVKKPIWHNACQNWARRDKCSVVLSIFSFIKIILLSNNFDILSTCPFLSIAATSSRLITFFDVPFFSKDKNVRFWFPSWLRPFGTRLSTTLAGWWLLNPETDFNRFASWPALDGRLHPEVLVGFTRKTHVPRYYGNDGNCIPKYPSKTQSLWSPGWEAKQGPCQAFLFFAHIFKGFTNDKQE